MLTGKKSAEKQKIVHRKIGSAIFQTETRRLHAFRCGLAGRWAGGRAVAKLTVVRPAPHDVQRDRALGELGRDPSNALVAFFREADDVELGEVVVDAEEESDGRLLLGGRPRPEDVLVAAERRLVLVDEDVDGVGVERELVERHRVREQPDELDGPQQQPGLLIDEHRPVLVADALHVAVLVADVAVGGAPQPVGDVVEADHARVVPIHVDEEARPHRLIDGVDLRQLREAHLRPHDHRLAVRAERRRRERLHQVGADRGADPAGVDLALHALELEQVAHALHLERRQHRDRHAVLRQHCTNLGHRRLPQRRHEVCQEVDRHRRVVRLR